MSASAIGIAVDAVKAAPPATLSLAWFAGWTPQNWLVAVTVAYTLVMLTHRLWHWNVPPAGKQ